MSGTDEAVAEEEEEERKEPTTLNELFDYIWFKPGISKGVTYYAIGWVFFDLFERGRHERKKSGNHCSTADFDGFIQELPKEKIDRLIEEAEQQFGQYAAEFMEDDIQKRIRAALDDGVVATVRSYTTGWKTFGMNVAAGVVAGVLFAAASLGLYFFVKVDPSINAMGKAGLQQSQPTTATPTAP